MDNNQFAAGGNTWTLSIPIALARQIRERYAVDLPNAWKEQWAGLSALLSDTWQATDVLWELCEAQAATRGLSREQWEAAMTAEASEAAGLALRWAVSLFIPRGERVEFLAAVKLEEMASETLQTKIDSPETRAAVETAVADAVAARLAAAAKQMSGS